MNRRLTRLVRLVVTLGLLVALSWFIWRNWDQIASVSLDQPWLLAAAGVLVLANSVATGEGTQAVIAPHGVRLTFSELFGLAVLTRFSNQILPNYVGAAIRASYLKRSHSVTYASFSSSFVVSNVIMLLVTGALAVVSFILMGADVSALESLVFAGVTVAVLSAALAFLPATWLANQLTKITAGPRIGRFTDRVIDMLTSYSTIRRSRGALLRCIAWTLIAVGLLILIYLALFSSLGAATDPIGIVFIAMLTNWSMVFAITPAGIGIRESIMFLAASIAGVAVGPTVVVALLLRVVSIIATGLPSLFYLKALPGHAPSR